MRGRDGARARLTILSNVVVHMALNFAELVSQFRASAALSAIDFFFGGSAAAAGAWALAGGFPAGLEGLSSPAFAVAAPKACRGGLWAGFCTICTGDLRRGRRSGAAGRLRRFTVL